MTQSELVTVSGLSCYYDDFKAVDNVSLQLFPGEVVSILGPNGAGKTTLINTLLGKKKNYQGEVSIFSSKPGSLAAKRLTGAMLQVASLPDNIKVREHIDLFRCYYVDPLPLEDLITLAGLEDYLDAYPKDLSGGQTQRLLFALAICGKPKLLFLDEPSVGMDIKSRHRLWKAIKTLKKQGVCIVLTTHYLEEADQLSDRIMFLHQGRIHQEGTPECIKKSFTNQTIQFASTATVTELELLPAVSTVSCESDRYQLTTSDSVVTLQAIFQREIDINELSIAASSLEDAFLAMQDQETDTTHSSKAA